MLVSMLCLGCKKYMTFFSHVSKANRDNLGNNNCSIPFMLVGFYVTVIA